MAECPLGARPQCFELSETGVLRDYRALGSIVVKSQKVVLGCPVMSFITAVDRSSGQNFTQSISLCSAQVAVEENPGGHAACGQRL